MTRSIRSLWLLAAILTGTVAWGELPGGIEIECRATPDRVKPGEQVEVSLTLKLPPGWIVYDLDQVPNSVLPTQVDLDGVADIAPLETFRSEGALEERDPKFKNKLVRFFPSSPTFRRPVRISSTARPGERVISGRVGFLAQYLLTKRFYIVSRARFETRVLVDPPLVARDSGGEPEPAVREKELTSADAAALFAPPPPKPPVPPFYIRVNSPLSTEPVRSESPGLPWNLVLFGAVLLLTAGVSSGVLTPVGTGSTDWLDSWTR